MAEKILSNRQVNNIVRKLAQKAKEDNMAIEKAFVFGSYAKNKAKKFSDLDLCFISKDFKDDIESEIYLRTELYFLNLNHEVPAVDIVAYKPKDFVKSVPLVYEIMENGKEIKLK